MAATRGDGPAAKRESRPELARIARPEIQNQARVDKHLVSVLTPTSFEAEQYRTLRSMLEQEAKADRSSTILAVTSASVGEGKTTTVMNLAGTLAQAPEARVLLVDADLRRPSLESRLGLAKCQRPGLAEAILDPGLRLDDVVLGCPRFNLSVLPAGRPPAAPYELLKSPRLGELLETARQRYDSIVLDTPPVIPVPDCRLIGRWVDGFLVIVAAHRTPRLLLGEALNLMDPAKVLGLVFNQDDRPLSGYSYAYSQPASGDWAAGWRKRTIASLGP